MAQGATEIWLERQWAQRPKQFDVTVDGARIACHGWNLGATDLPGILLVHGFRAHAHWWDHIAPSLADRYRVVALSLSGMGDSDSRDGYSQRQFGRDMIGVAQACGFDPAILVTHSFGTLGALQAITEAPDRFSRLIMIDAGLPIEGAPEHVLAVPPRRVYPTREAALERFRLLPESPAPEPLVRAYIGDHSVRQDVDGWTWKFDPRLPISMNRQPNRRVEVEKLSLPVDIILGDMTSIMTPARLAAAQKLAPHAGAPILIPASEHHVMIDQPIALVAALRALLANPPLEGAFPQAGHLATRETRENCAGAAHPASFSGQPVLRGPVGRALRSWRLFACLRDILPRATSIFRPADRVA